MNTAHSLVVTIAFAACMSSASADEFTLAAGAGFRRPLVDVAAAYEKQSGNKVLQTYGHMGQVIAQARDSDKIAIVCGDSAVLDTAKGVSFARKARLGLGRLVIAYRKGMKFDRPDDLTGADFKRIGMPDQTNAIYGKAGRQMLERTQLAASIDPKLVAVATVPQVTSYVASGEVDAGFVNATDAIGAGGNIGGFVEVDAKLYDPVEVVCATVASTTPSAAAEGFLQFLETPAARSTLQRYGL